MNKPSNSHNDLFQETLCRNGEITETEITLEEVHELNPEDVDFHWDEAFGRISIRKEEGERLEYFGSISGVGEVTERLLTEQMWAPGNLITPRQIAPIFSMSRTYEQRRLHNLISARLAKLREAFGETAKRPWFFLTRKRPFSFCWNAERSWRLIEKIAQPVSQSWQPDRTATTDR